MTSSNLGAKALSRDQQAALWGPQLVLLETEAEQLLMPWIALASALEIDPAIEPKRAVKQWVRSQPGGSQRVWKALSASGPLVWTDLFTRAGGIEGFRETILLFREFHTQAAVPHQFVSLAVSRLDQSKTLGEQLDRCTFYPVAVREARAALAEGRWDRFVEEFDLVDPWWADLYPIPDRNQRKAGWPWLVKSARLWHEEQTRRKYARKLMRSLAHVEVNGVSYRALTSNYELWKTSVEMHNCLSAIWYADGIRRGHSVIVVGRRTVTGEPVIALQLAMDQNGRLSLSRAKGLCNRDILPAERDDAEIVRSAFEMETIQTR